MASSQNYGISNYECTNYRNSGIGYGLASFYLKANASVFGISRRHNQELDTFPNFLFLSLDLSNYELVKEELPVFLQDVDFFDLAILNAGILGKVNDLRKTTLSEIDRVMNTNVWANKVVIDLLFENVKKINQIVAISSIASISGNRGWNAYALSKTSLNMLIKMYAKEYPDTHFCSLAPGIIDTAIQDYISALPEDDRFPTILRMKELKGTGKMPDPVHAAPMLARAFKKVLQFESGSYLDVREL
ncbi:SDR family NAD(P)-dependent oxidoreductase [Bacteroidota bacterium]